jgi:histidinol-phosphate aminotransferase
MPSLQPREAVRRMAPYVPPSGGRRGKLRLDFNENTVGCSPRVEEFLRAQISAEALSVYPEYRDPLAALARFFDVDETELAITNGTDEAIQLLINTYIDDGDEVLMLKPSYAMYRFYSELAGAAVREIEYGCDLSFPFHSVLGAIGGRTRAILISNPNNPTGSGIGVDRICEMLNAAPQAAVLIDEAYFEFSGVTALPLICQFPNLLVSRTFSKAYGMAAMRCGCLLSNRDNMAWIRKAQSPYSVNALAARAVCAAVEDREYAMRYAAEVISARELACDGLRKLGVPFYPSQANFLLFNAGSRAIEIRDALRERGVLVRDRSYELPGCVRVTIGTREQTERFLKHLEELWTQ